MSLQISIVRAIKRKKYGYLHSIIYPETEINRTPKERPGHLAWHSCSILKDSQKLRNLCRQGVLFGLLLVHVLLMHLAQTQSSQAKDMRSSMLRYGLKSLIDRSKKPLSTTNRGIWPASHIIRPFLSCTSSFSACLSRDVQSIEAQRPEV